MLGRSARDGRITNADAKPEALRVMNPAQYIDYQDCHYLGRRRMLCSGLNNYRPKADGPPFRLGGFEIVNLKDNRPVWQVPIEFWSPSGLPMTQNPFFVEPPQACAPISCRTTTSRRSSSTRRGEPAARTLRYRLFFSAMSPSMSCTSSLRLKRQPAGVFTKRSR